MSLHWTRRTKRISHEIRTFLLYGGKTCSVLKERLSFYIIYYIDSSFYISPHKVKKVKTIWWPTVDVRYKYSLFLNACYIFRNLKRRYQSYAFKLKRRVVRCALSFKQSLLFTFFWNILRKLESRLCVIFTRAKCLHPSISCLLKHSRCFTMICDKEFGERKAGQLVKSESVFILWKHPRLGFRQSELKSYRTLGLVSTLYDMSVIKGVLVCRCVDTAELRWLEEDKWGGQM